MKNTVLVVSILVILISCNKKTLKTNLQGTWKMIYAESTENDSIKLKDLSNTTFIKIINKTHFSYFNQNKNETSNFYSGAGKYFLEKDNYTEELSFTKFNELKNHKFSFKIKIIGDTLIQYGTEKVKAAGINRQIVEKYIKIN